MEISADSIFILCVLKTHTRNQSLITIANKCMRKGELREGVSGFGGMISHWNKNQDAGATKTQEEA